jgi:hypothetical protein
MKNKLLIAVVMVFMIACSCNIPELIREAISNRQATPQNEPATVATLPSLQIATPVPTMAFSPEELELQTGSVMDLIQSEVIGIRGLQPNGEFTRATLTDEQLKDKVTNEFFADYTEEEAKSDVRELAALGLLPKGYDIYKLYIDLYSEQIAGYYDPETKDMYVVQGEAFKGPEKMTYAHEYVHALQDQTWDLQNGLKSNDEYCEDHTEYCAGVDSLVEGDASLTEQYWFFSYATQQDQQDVYDFYETYSSPVYDTAPYFLQQDFLFPYSQGMVFVESLYGEGGWSAVDRAYKNPPQTTEQILHPERYPQDIPVDILLPDLTSTLGNGWEEVTRNVMGEWYLDLVLFAGYDPAMRLDEETAKSAGTGWGGDSYLVYWNESTQEQAFVMVSQWETSTDANEFWDAMKEYGRLRWNSPAENKSNNQVWTNTVDGYIRIIRNGNEITWLITSTPAITDKVLAGIGK